MAAFLSKYGTARHIYIPIVKRAVVDFAVSADWTPAAGDVKISKDGGAAANVTNLPTAITMGNTAMWDFSLTATEMQAAQVVVMVSDSATKAVEDQSFIIETYGNASGQHAFDLGTAMASQTVGTATAVTTVNGLANNVITAASINAAALNGKGDWNVGKTGYSLTQTFPSNFSSLAITVGGAVTAGTVSDKTGYSLTSQNWAVAGDAMTLTAAYDFAKGTAAVAEAYAADGAAFTPVQALYMIWAKMAEMSISGTTLTANKLDGVTAAMTFTLDSSTSPSSITRAT